MELKSQTQYNGRPVVVVAGFDPMLHRFFMIIEPVEEDNPDTDQDSGLIYSNLSDKDIPLESTKIDASYFRAKLREMKIVVEPYFFNKVEMAND